MRKDRDLLDYVSVGAEIAQAAQLSAISSSLENVLRLSAAQAIEQAEHREQEARRQATENGIREFVFQGERLINGMRKGRMEANPRGALFVASRLQQQIERAGIATSRVRDYPDKESVQRLLDAVTSFSDDCEKLLSFEDSMTVQQCLDYQAEEEQLLEAVAWAEQKEDAAQQNRARVAALEQTQTELDSIARPTKPRFHPAISYSAFAVGLVFVAPGLWYGFIMGRIAWFWLLIPGAYFWWVWLAGIMRVDKPEVVRLRQEIESVRMAISDPERDEDGQQFVAKFGKRSAADYEKLLNERRKAIQNLLDPNAGEVP